MRRANRVGRVALGVSLLSLGLTAPCLAQANADRRPDRWFVTRTTDQVTRESVPHMLYLGRDGTLLIVQCASRDGSRTGGWAFTVRRDDWAFPADFLQGWWSVDSEPTVGPLDWGGVGVMVLLNDDALKARLEQPVRERIVLTVAQGTRRWELLFRPNDLDQAVAEFGPACRAT